MHRRHVAPIALVAVGLFSVSTAVAGTKYQTSLVPNVAGTAPGFAFTGASVKLDDNLLVKGKIKTVVDAGGNRITTDDANPLDDYKVEIDLAVPATAAATTISISFDLKNGNGKFQADIGTDPVFLGASSGAGVAIDAVRVYNDSGTVIGVGGISLK